MARVGEIIREISEQAHSEPGLFWNEKSREKIREAEILFQIAIRTIDDSAIPTSVRKDVEEESALKLKEILDHVFTHSREKTTLPKDKSFPSWTMPGTAITVTRLINDDANNEDYYFSQETVENIDRMYRFIDSSSGAEPVDDLTAGNQYASPNLYDHFAYTPGYLIPPKWYARLPEGIKSTLEIPIGDQSILQYIMASIVGLIYLPITFLSIKNLLNTYRERDKNNIKSTGANQTLHPSWKRLLVVLPLAPASIVSRILTANRINFTGNALVNSNWLFDIATFIFSGITIILLFEAISSSGAIWMMRFRGRSSSLELNRMRNLIMPFSRFLGAICAVILLYQLLLRLGMPPNAVIAFSAVPGLAIGLGGSRLLSNLFAGIAIQSDRPIRVGEFCKIGGDTGFVSRIGLRSIDMITLSGRITIPNNKVEDATILNYSGRSNSFADNAAITQGIDIEVKAPDEFGTGQLNETIRRISQFINNHLNLNRPVVHFSQEDSKSSTLILTAKTSTDNWNDFLNAKQELSAEVKTIIAIVKNLKHTVSIDYQTPRDKRDIVPNIIRSAVNADPDLSITACRLSSLSEYSIDFTFLIDSTHSDAGKFFDSIAAMKAAILLAFEENRITIPFPTSVEIQRHNSDNHITSSR
ncbi:MAG: mechanosensitive ion channel family protein [Synechococcus sp.]